jgi:hypothetical protein
MMWPCGGGSVLRGGVVTNPVQSAEISIFFLFGDPCHTDNVQNFAEFPPSCRLSGTLLTLHVALVSLHVASLI